MTRITLSEGEKSLILAQEMEDAPGWQSLARKIRNAERMEQYGCNMTSSHVSHGKCPGIDFPVPAEPVTLPESKITVCAEAALAASGSGVRDLPATDPGFSVQEVNEGIWALLFADGTTVQPWPNRKTALEGSDILLCDQCYELLTGDVAQCQNGCSLRLDHEGECGKRYRDETHCERCGREDRLTRMNCADLLDTMEQNGIEVTP